MMSRRNLVPFVQWFSIAVLALLTACITGQEGSECDATEECDDGLECLQGFSREDGECEFHDLSTCRKVCEDGDDEICQDFFGSDDAVCISAACGPGFCEESSPFD